MSKTRTGIRAHVFLATVTCIAIFAFVQLVYAHTVYVQGEMEVSSDVYDSAEHTLRSYFGMEEQEDSSPEGMTASSIEPEVGIAKMGRMTQRVTVTRDAGILPISGTVTKMQDAYYPGTYELKFSTKAILTSDASVQVNISVDKGEKVYILTGDKELGYTEYAVVAATDDNCVEFSTDMIRNYTISTTDIRSAQAAMASVMTN